MLAQVNLSDAPADQFKWTVLIIIGLILVGLQIWTATRQNKTVITPDPLRVEKLDKFATRDFCEVKHQEIARRLDAHDADVRAIYNEIKKDREDAQKHASARSATIYAKMDQMHRDLTDKIDSTSDRVIDTLNKLNLLRKP